VSCLVRHIVTVTEFLQVQFGLETSRSTTFSSVVGIPGVSQTVVVPVQSSRVELAALPFVMPGVVLRSIPGTVELSDCNIYL